MPVTHSSPSSPTSKTFARYVAPFAPLALAMAMSAVPQSSSMSADSSLVEKDIPDTVTAVKCDDNIADFQACHDNYPTGCSKAAGYDAYLNYLKNGTPSAPTGGVTFLGQSAFDNLNTNTPEGLGSGNNHASFKDQLANLGEGSQFGVIGYLYYYQATGAESSNCELTGPDKEGGNVDFHIGIGFDSSLGRLAETTPKLSAVQKKQLQQSSVIVEMTPHYRASFEDGIWTLANLQPALGHKVRIVGRLLIDSEHNKPADNCALNGTAAQKNHCWRYSIWELHPVTRFEYCNDDSCTQDSSDWIALGSASSKNSRGTAASVESGENSPVTGGDTRKPERSTRTNPARSGPPRQP
jgi:hypothetical protein